MVILSISYRIMVVGWLNWLFDNRITRSEVESDLPISKNDEGGNFSAMGLMCSKITCKKELF